MAIVHAQRQTQSHTQRHTHTHTHAHVVQAVVLDCVVCTRVNDGVPKYESVACRNPDVNPNLPFQLSSTGSVRTLEYRQARTILHSDDGDSGHVAHWQVVICMGTLRYATSR